MEYLLRCALIFSGIITFQNNQKPIAMRHTVHIILLLATLVLSQGLKAQLTIPYTEAFDTMTNISSFTSQGFSYYGCVLSLSTSYSCNSTKQLRFSGGGTVKNRVLVFPNFTESINGLTLVFNTRPESYTSTYSGLFDVGYVTDATDTSTFVALQTYDCTTFPNGCLLKECRFASAPAGARIAMRNRPRGSNFYWFVDDIKVLDTLGLCHWPTSVGMTAVASTSVTLVAADSTESTSDFRLIFDGSDRGVFYNQTTINGLVPGSSHSAVVRSICSGDSSAYTLTYNFTTRCSNTETAPFFDNMESYAAQSEPSCYTTIVEATIGTSHYPRVFRNAANAYSDTGYLRFQGLCNVLVLPTINLPADQMHVSFRMRNSDTTSGTLRAGVLTTLGDTSSFIPLYSITNQGTQYNEYEFWTDDTPAATAYVAFFWNARLAKAACFLDDISVEAAVGCRRPNLTYIDSVDTASISLRWNNVSVASGFQVCYGTSNDTATATIISNITGNTYTVSGLAPATDYWFWVRSVCDDTTSWQPIGSARTLCLGGLQAPVNITFDSTQIGSAPRCWTSMQTLNYITVQDEQYFGFGPVLQFAPSYGSTSIIAMPYIYLSSTDMHVTVTAAIDALDTATLELGYVTDLSSANSFVPLVSVTATTLTDYIFDTDTIGDDTIWLAFRSTSPSSQIGLAYISSISVTALSSCRKPMAVAVDSVTDVSAIVRWSSTGAFGYELAIATLADIDSALYYATTDTALNLISLQPSTQYYVWMRSNCLGEYSEWTSPQTFYTMCDSGFCTINIHLVDNDYQGQLFNYAYVGVVAVVNGIPVALAGGPGTSDAVVDVNLPVCSTDSVAFIWIDTNLYEASGIFSSLSYSFTVGDGTILAAGNGAGMYNGAVIYTTATPCPTCPPPLSLTVDAADTASSGLTLTWIPAPGTTEWVVSIDGATVDTVSDALYTFMGLAAGTTYNLGVATLCDNATSQFVTCQGVTACAGAMCEVQVEMGSLHEYNIVWGGGNAVEVYAGNSLRGSASVPNGSEAATAYIPVCDGDSLTLVWHAGSNMYASYCAFTAIAPGDDTLYVGTGSNVTDTLATSVVHCTGCMRPDSVAVSNVGNSSAVLSWSSTGATSYRLTVGDTVIVTTDTTVTVTGLTPSSSYSYWLQSNCAGGNSLAISGAFATACGPYPLPYFEDFDNTQRDQLPLCWSAHNQYPDYMDVMTPSVYRAANRAYSGLNSLELASDGHHRPMAVSIPLTGAPANRLHISFWLNGATHTGFEAGLMTDPSDTATFVPLYVITQAVLNYWHYQFTTDSATFSDSVYYFALRYTSTLAMYNDLFLDDLAIRRIPDCSEEFIDITVLNTDESSVSVGWNVGAGDNIGAYYNVVLFNDDGAVADSINTNNDTLTIGNLPPATYFICVKLVCGGTVSAVSDTAMFTIENAVCAIPVIDSAIVGEDFITIHFSTDADTTELQLTSPAGITRTALTTANNYTFDNLDHSSSYIVSLRAHCNGDMSEWVTTAVSTITVDCGTPTNLAVSDITFNSVNVSWSAAGDESMWNVHVFNNSYDSIYNCNDTSLIVNDLETNVEYTVQVQAICGIHSDISGPWSDILVFATDYCRPVNNVTVTDIDVTTAVVGWDAGDNGNGSWIIEYGPTGFSRGEGESRLTEVNPYVISGLQENNTYDVYVATVCDDDNSSIFSEVVTFTTGVQGVDVVGDNLITLYPNPAGKTVTVTCDVPAEMKIIDLSGRTVLATTLITTETVVSLEELALGAYFVRLLNSQGTIVHKLIVK